MYSIFMKVYICFFLCVFSMQYLKNVLQLSLHKKTNVNTLKIIKIKVPLAFEIAASFIIIIIPRAGGSMPSKPGRSAPVQPDRLGRVRLASPSFSKNRQGNWCTYHKTS